MILKIHKTKEIELSKSKSFHYSSILLICLLINIDLFVLSIGLVKENKMANK